ncbi:MAG: hypothetical protein ACXWJZ_11945 [Burkholderiaceae bacterium]
MRASAALSAFGGTPSKREVIDVPEPGKQDKSLDKLIVVRKQRIERLERERVEARVAWRAERQALRTLKERWRKAVEAAQNGWQAARAEFFRMAMTSGQFRCAKAVYERMKEDAAQLHMECRAAVAPCKTKKTEFFEARRRVMDAHRQHEKLTMLRDEYRLLHAEPEF